MEERIDFLHMAQEPLGQMMSFDRALYRSELESPLIDLVKLRTSQINGCEHSVDVFTKRLLRQGADEERLETVETWEESEGFSERERAALAWAEAVTKVRRDHVPDEVYEAARGVFEEEELVNLTYVVALTNAWNRLTIPFRLPVGAVVPAQAVQPAQEASGDAQQPSGDEHITSASDEQDVAH